MGSERVVWGVAALIHAVSDALATRFAACSVQGELSGFSRAPSGHCYFTLKDAEGNAALLRCAMFRRAVVLLDFQPRDGQRVELRGRMAVYEPRGELQFVVEAMRPAGQGALLEQFLQLKAKLEAQGLFDPARKRPIARFPRRIGVVTSLGAAALRDVLACLARRAPHVEVRVFPSLVQGDSAPSELVQAMIAAGRGGDVDTLIVCRGGGSLEDLWAFNDERTVRAIAACAVPVVCGVGHETDVTLADFASDLRAPTPTAAAELAAPATAECLASLDAMAQWLNRRATHALDTQSQRLDNLMLRLSRPGERLHRETRHLDAHAHRLARAAHQANARHVASLTRRQESLDRSAHSAVERRSRHIAVLADRLAALDPARVLARGYAWLEDANGKPISGVHALQPGDNLRAVLRDGAVHVRVTDTDPTTVNG